MKRGRAAGGRQARETGLGALARRAVDVASAGGVQPGSAGSGAGGRHHRVLPAVAPAQGAAGRAVLRRPGADRGRLRGADAFAAITLGDIRRSGERDRESLGQRAAHAGPIAEGTLLYGWSSTLPGERHGEHLRPGTLGHSATALPKRHDVSMTWRPAALLTQSRPSMRARLSSHAP